MLSLTAAQRETVITAALTATDGTRDDLLFAAGSMVDGIANAGSDLDVYFIGSGAVAGADTTVRKLEKNGTVGLLDEREINLSILDPGGLTELGVGFARCLASLDSGDGIGQLDSENDLKILHRIRTGEPLLGARALSALRTSLNTGRLAEYLANLHAVTAINRLIDVGGEQAAQNSASAAWMFREALVHVGHLALALAGETSPGRKWLVRLLLRGERPDPLRTQLLRLLLESSSRVQEDVAELRGRLRALLLDSSTAVIGPYAKRLAREKL
jgi:hypothetical protein